MKRFVLTPTAKSDLRDILSDIAEDNPDASLKMHGKFLEAFQELGLSPGIGHFHDEFLNRRFRFWNVNPYVVAYAWETSPIRIVSVVHGARDLAAFFTMHEGIH